MNKRGGIATAMMLSILVCVLDHCSKVNATPYVHVCRLYPTLPRCQAESSTGSFFVGHEISSFLKLKLSLNFQQRVHHSHFLEKRRFYFWDDAVNTMLKKNWKVLGRWLAINSKIGHSTDILVISCCKLCLISLVQWFRATWSIS